MYLFINEYNGLYIEIYKYHKWTHDLFLVLNLSKIYKIWFILINKNSGCDTILKINYLPFSKKSIHSIKILEHILYLP